MVNDLRELLSDNVASPPHDNLDLGAVLAGGRRRVRRRRLATLGGTALATAALVATGECMGTGETWMASAGMIVPTDIDLPSLRAPEVRCDLHGVQSRQRAPAALLRRVRRAGAG